MKMNILKLGNISIISFQQRVYSKRKQFASCGSKFFPFRVDPYSGGTWCAGKQTGSPKGISLIENCEKSTLCTQPL